MTTLPLPHSRGPLGRNIIANHVRAATTRTVVSQSQVPPVVSGGHIPVSGSSHGPSHAFPIFLLMELLMGYLMGNLMELLMHLLWTIVWIELSTLWVQVSTTHLLL